MRPQRRVPSGPVPPPRSLPTQRLSPNSVGRPEKPAILRGFAKIGFAQADRRQPSGEPNEATVAPFLYRRAARRLARRVNNKNTQGSVGLACWQSTRARLIDIQTKVDGLRRNRSRVHQPNTRFTSWSLWNRIELHAENSGRISRRVRRWSVDSRLLMTYRTAERFRTPLS